MSETETARAQNKHHAYVLRIWRETEEDEWRFCLKDTQGVIRDRHFVSLEKLTVHLMDLVGTPPLTFD